MRTIKNTKKLPVWFVDPNTGDFIELDFVTVTFNKKEK